MSAPVRPFTIDVPGDVLDDLRERLGRTRLPSPLEGAGWGYGMDLGYLQELLTYWRERFDWRAQERILNGFDQFVTEIRGEQIHLLHVRSPQEDAFPLILTHGWPGSVAEFVDVIGPLTDPAAHGGDPADAFHVVCPSLPGYGFSGPTRRRKVDIREVARINLELMERLGYGTFGAQGGDWGAIASSHMAVLAPGRVRGLHLNLVLGGPTEEQRGEPTDDERAYLEEAARFQREETGYSKIQGTRPHTVGVALDDSPAGLAAWIVEKFRAWSDCDGDIESVFTKDELLRNVTIYWVTGTATSAARLYYESVRSGRFGVSRIEGGRIEVPTAGAIFPQELARPSRRWAENQYRIVRWTRFDRGGHFAAMEVPDVLVGDIRAFFRDVRRGTFDRG